MSTGKDYLMSSHLRWSQEDRNCISAWTISGRDYRSVGEDNFCSHLEASISILYTLFNSIIQKQTNGLRFHTYKLTDNELVVCICLISKDYLLFAGKSSILWPITRLNSWIWVSEKNGIFCQKIKEFTERASSQELWLVARGSCYSEGGLRAQLIFWIQRVGLSQRSLTWHKNLSKCAKMSWLWKAGYCGWVRRILGRGRWWR